jgi:cyclic lactone autoinducer peptide
MKKKINFMAIANLFAFALMISSVNSTCLWIHHQPEVPDNAKKYRKF